MTEEKLREWIEGQLIEVPDLPAEHFYLRALKKCTFAAQMTEKQFTLRYVTPIKAKIARRMREQREADELFKLAERKPRRRASPENLQRKQREKIRDALLTFGRDLLRATETNERGAVIDIAGNIDDYVERAI